MFGITHNYSLTDLENAVKFAIGETARELLNAVESNGWAWATNERAWFAADETTVIWVTVAYDETGMSYGIECPNVKPLWFESIHAAISTLALA